MAQTVDEETRNKVFDLLLSIDEVPSSSEELEDFFIDTPTKKKSPLLSLSQHKKQAQEAWLALLQHGLTKDQRKKVLEVMATSRTFFL